MTSSCAGSGHPVAFPVASYGFDAIACVKVLDGRPDRRFLMWRVLRYDPKLLRESLAELGWNTLMLLPKQ